MLNQLIAETTTAKTYEIQTSITCRLLACDDVRWNVKREATATLYHHVSADMAELMTKYCGAYDGIVIYCYFAGKLGGVADNQATT